jgi:outer membrane protein TolC
MRVFVVLFCLAVVPPAWAQAPPAPAAAPPLPLSEAIAWARAHHPLLAAASARAAAAKQEPEMARSLMPPMLDATIWQWPVTSFNPADVNMYMFMIEQELPGRGKRQLRVAAAEREADRMVADVAVRDRAVVAGVRQAYAALRATERQVAATGASLPAAADLVRATETAYAGGRGTQASVVRATLAQTEVIERMAMLSAEADMRRIALNVAMGRVPGSPLGALDDAPPYPAVPTLESLLDRATAAHPEIAMSRADVAAAEAATSVAHAERKPDWVVQGGYMLMPGDAGAWTARVGLTWPTAPWTKKRLSATTAQAEARTAAARADLEATRQQIAQMVGEARATLVGVLARLEIVRGTMLPQARHMVEATGLAFGASQVPLSEVIDAQKMQLATEVQIAELEGEADIAWAALESAVGSDVGPETPTINPADEKE